MKMIILTIFNLGLMKLFMLIWKHSSVFIPDILTWFHCKTAIDLSIYKRKKKTSKVDNLLSLSQRLTIFFNQTDHFR